MIDVRMDLLKSFDRVVKNRTRVRVHHGAAEVLGRVVLLDRDTLEPGDSAPVQLRLEEPLCPARGDRIVLRFYSPMFTLGGAEVIDVRPRKHKRFRDEVLQELALKESGGPTDLVLDALRRAAIRGATLSDLENTHLVAAERLPAVLEDLVAAARVTRVGGRLYDSEALQTARREVCQLAHEYQAMHALAWGMPRAELQERLEWTGNRNDFAALLDHLAGVDAAPQIHLRPEAVRVGSTSRELSEQDVSQLDAIENALREGRFAPPSASELRQSLRDAERFAAYVGVLEEEGRIVRLNDALLYHPDALQEIESRLRRFLNDHDTMKMGDFKDLTDISRKYAVPLLEYFDRRGITRRDGDVRKAGPQLHG
jgi:selenocysteine-specific elongation factor